MGELQLASYTQAGFSNRQSLQCSLKILLQKLWGALSHSLLCVCALFELRLRDVFLLYLSIHVALLLNTDFASRKTACLWVGIGVGEAFWRCSCVWWVWLWVAFRGVYCPSDTVWWYVTISSWQFVVWWRLLSGMRANATWQHTSFLKRSDGTLIF